ncbi:MAG: hypothetical protein WC931_05960 [Bacilli bacterium]
MSLGKGHMFKFLLEKMREAEAMNDFWFKKHQDTDSKTAYEEYKIWQAKEQAYYDCLEELKRENKDLDLDEDEICKECI